MRALSEPFPLLSYRLLTEFRRLFEGRIYKHRASTQGDFVAMQLYEDLVATGKSQKLIEAIKRHQRVLNSQNRRRGIEARRGDGTFGEIIPGADLIVDRGYEVARGQIATVEIGVEVKILAKAMIKQIDRVISDLRNQVAQFQRGTGNPMCVAVVGINQATRYVGYEGRRRIPTTGQGGFLHPSQEALKAEQRLAAEAKPSYDEFLVLRFRATNERPYPFEWVDYKSTQFDYAAALTRLSREYDRRF